MRTWARLVSGVVAVMILAGAGLVGGRPAAGSTAGRSSTVAAGARSQIRQAFGHLVSRHQTVASEREFVQGYDPALQRALIEAAGAGASADFGEVGGTPRFSETLGVLRRASSTVVTVPVTFATAGGTQFTASSSRFVATAVRTGGRWKVSWATTCTIVETAGIPCPPTPRGVTATVPPPAAVAPSNARLLAPGLIDPSALALEPDGSLLIADPGRDQVLRRAPGGRLQVFAGTGQSGFSGDGGAATGAELDLGGPTALAVASDGTVYLADTMNDRVRAVGADGVITTVAGNGTGGHTGDGGRATDAEMNGPEGLALGPDGSLYIADGTYVRKVTPGGIITTIAGGGPPYGLDVQAVVSPGGPSTVAFVPDGLAVDGAGDLDVFSFSPKMIFQLPAGPRGPSGTGITVLVPADYATALATAPDGSVVVALHGAGLQRISGGHVQSLYDFLDTAVVGYGVPGTRGAFSPQGVAVAPDGTIYADTGAGNGYSPQIALVQVSPGGTAAVLAVAGPVTASLPAVGAPGFPAATYPAPVSARRGSGVSSCPSRTGLQVFDGAARSAAASDAAAFNTAFHTALTTADRSWWSSTYGEWADPTGLGRHAVVRVEPATHDLYAPVIARACGSAVLDRSVAVVVGRSVYSQEISHFFFIERAGRPLVYYQNA